MSAVTRVTILIAFAGVLCGCGDDRTGPGALEFPALPDSLLADICSEGNVTVGASVSGIVSDSDCDSNLGYVERWRVRVASQAEVTLSVLEAEFGGYLSIMQLQSVEPAILRPILFQYWTHPSGPAPLLTSTLTMLPDEDYFLGIGGTTYTDTGSYTVEIE